MCSDQIRGLAFRRSGETNDVIQMNEHFEQNRSIWSDHLLPGRMSDGWIKDALFFYQKDARVLPTMPCDFYDFISHSIIERETIGYG